MLIEMKDVQVRGALDVSRGSSVTLVWCYILLGRNVMIAIVRLLIEFVITILFCCYMGSVGYNCLCHGSRARRVGTGNNPDLWEIHLETWCFFGFFELDLLLIQFISPIFQKHRGEHFFDVYVAMICKFADSFYQFCLTHHVYFADAC